jgi:hypothetical protein
VRAVKDHYALLDVPRTATDAQLRRAYETALARANRDGATKHMVEIVNAYEVLSHPGRRAIYDDTGTSWVPERVPNTFGRAMPFRGGAPALGQGRRAHASARYILPAAPKTSRAKRAGQAIAVVAGLAAALTVVLVVLNSRASSPVSAVVPGAASNRTLVQVVCGSGPGAYSFWGRPGQVVQCSGGEIPRWGVRRAG